jgi:hypothetical protein
MEDKKLVKCANCGKEVSDMQLDRYGECRTCQVADKDSDMCVGDLNAK